MNKAANLQPFIINCQRFIYIDLLVLKKCGYTKQHILFFKKLQWTIFGLKYSVQAEDS